jgi:hypothetical protein
MKRARAADYGFLNYFSSDFTVSSQLIEHTKMVIITMEVQFDGDILVLSYDENYSLI